MKNLSTTVNGIFLLAQLLLLQGYKVEFDAENLRLTVTQLDNSVTGLRCGRDGQWYTFDSFDEFAAMSFEWATQKLYTNLLTD